MKAQNLEEAFIVKLQALYDIEAVLIKALPKMAKKATNADLKEAFSMHLKETVRHSERLEEIFKTKDLKPKKLKCEGIRGIVADAEWSIENAGSDEVMDAVLIASAQYAEHYEMAGYGTAVEWAQLLGDSEVADLLSETFRGYSADV